MARSMRIPAAASDRRLFLAQLGLWGSALGGLNLSARPAPDPGPAAVEAPLFAEGRIGLLVPSPQACRGLDEHLLAGFRLALDQARAAGADLRLELLRSETRLAPLASRRAAESLLQKQQADLVVALAQPGTVASLAPLFQDAGRCLLAVDGGANLVRRSEANPFVFYNTLGQWQAAWALGRWASRTYHGEGFVVASSFETGHDALRAFRLGAESAGRGERGFHVPRMPLKEAPEGLAPLETVDLIRRTGPAYVVALAGRGDGLDFLKAYQQAGLLGQIPLVGSAFLAEDALAAGRGDLLDGFTTASGWSAALPTAANRSFLAAYRKAAGREANAFAALGFDTGRMLLAALRASGGQVRFVREALEQAAWDGPGGRRSLDPASHVATGDVHVTRFEQRLGQSRTAVLHQETQLANGSFEVDALLRSVRPALVNPYPVY